MTDRYPPFALDQGGHEAGSSHERDITAAAPAARPGWTAGRTVAVVAGSVLLWISVGSGGIAGTLLVVDQGARDQDGFVMSDARTVTSPTHAVTSGDLQLHTDAPGVSWPGRLLGDARVTADPGTGDGVFLGIAATSDVESYLAGVGHETITDAREGQSVSTSPLGGAPPTAPTEQQFWVEQESGTGEQAVTWPLTDGDWTVVVMNPDATSGIAVDVAVGAEVPALAELAGLLALVAVLGLLAGAALVAVPLRRVSREARGA